MGPKPKVEEKPPAPEADSAMAYIDITYNPTSSNPDIILEPVSLRMHINTHCRTDIAIDYLKRSLYKKIVEKIAELGGPSSSGSNMGEMLRRTNTTNFMDSNEVFDSEAAEVGPLETEEDVNRKTVRTWDERAYSFIPHPSFSSSLSDQKVKGISKST